MFETENTELPVENTTEEVIEEVIENNENTSDVSEGALVTEEVEVDDDIVSADNTEVIDESDLPNEYVVNFTLSYSQYLAGQHKDSITDEEAAVLIASVVNHYENEADATEVRSFFEIPQAQNHLVEFRFYNIGTEVVSNDTTYQVLLVKFTLTFGERIITNNEVVSEAKEVSGVENEGENIEEEGSSEVDSDGMVTPEEHLSEDVNDWDSEEDTEEASEDSAEETSEA